MGALKLNCANAKAQSLAINLSAVGPVIIRYSWFPTASNGVLTYSGASLLCAIRDCLYKLLLLSVSRVEQFWVDSVGIDGVI